MGESTTTNTTDSNEQQGAAIYVASRASIPERGEMWRGFRNRGVRITSSWIDEDGDGQTADFSDLWLRITNEIRDAAALVLYAESDDFPLKGAFTEAGIALGMGKPVIVCLPGLGVLPCNYRPIGSWIAHPLVTRCDSVDAAIRLAQRPAITTAIRSRASLAAVEGDALPRQEVIARIEKQIRLWNDDTVTMAFADVLADLKSMPAAASSPLPAEPPPTCERCADDANYEPAGLDDHTNLWLHRGRTGEGYICRLKHPNGLAAPAESRQEGEQVCKCGLPKDDAIHSYTTEWQQMHTFMPKDVAIITRYLVGTTDEDGGTMGRLYTEASAVVDRLSTELSALRADVKLMRPVVDAAIAYTVEFATGMTDEALLRLSVAVNAYKDTVATPLPETPDDDDLSVCLKCKHFDSTNDRGVCQKVRIVAQFPDGFDLICGCKCEFAAPVVATDGVEGEHPEDFCKKCGRPNIVWFAPNAIWNQAVRAANEPEILCPVCFVQLAEAAGVNAVWEVAPQNYHAEERKHA